MRLGESTKGRNCSLCNFTCASVAFFQKRPQEVEKGEKGDNLSSTAVPPSPPFAYAYAFSRSRRKSSGAKISAVRSRKGEASPFF